MTMGIVGFGRIGRQVGRIARAMGMRVLAYSRTETEEGRAIAEYVPLDTLLAEADVVSLHCPLFPETAGIINRESIAKMKEGAILINNSRGGLIVEQDLADALNSGKLCAAGLDVASEEPIRADNPLLHAKNCNHHAAHLVGGETVPRPDSGADRGECGRHFWPGSRSTSSTDAKLSEDLRNAAGGRQRKLHGKCLGPCHRGGHG